MQAGSLSVDDPKTNESQLHYGDQPMGPGKTRENPAGVFPHSDPREAPLSHQDRADQPMISGAAGEQAPAIPQPAGGIPGTGNPDDSAQDPRVVFSNPILFSELMIKLSHALTETIDAIEQESGSGVGGVGRQLQNKFKGWRDEVDLMRKGKAVFAPEGQGQVEREGGDGLYKD